MILSMSRFSRFNRAIEVIIMVSTDFFFLGSLLLRRVV